MNRQEFKCEFKLLGIEQGAGTFEGIAAVFTNIDRQNDVIVPGAFKRTLKDFVTRGFLASGHNWSDPIGTIDDARETYEGLYVKGEFHTTPAAQLARTVIRERLARGKTVSMSVGFETRDSDLDTKGVRYIKDLELYEVSVVTVPANPLARVVGVKSHSTRQPMQTPSNLTKEQRQLFDLDSRFITNQLNKLQRRRNANLLRDMKARQRALAGY